jgi:hypothetical protein
MWVVWRCCPALARVRAALRVPVGWRQVWWPVLPLQARKQSRLPELRLSEPMLSRWRHWGRVPAAGPAISVALPVLRPGSTLALRSESMLALLPGSTRALRSGWTLALR